MKLNGKVVYKHMQRTSDTPQATSSFVTNSVLKHLVSDWIQTWNDDYERHPD